MTTYHSSSRFLLLISVLLCAMAVLAQAPVGTISVVRQVEVTTTTVDKGRDWITAKQNQAILAGFGVRTMKRSQAEIKFKDNSKLRLNERTEISVQEAEKMRKIRLAQGAVWVQVTKGANTSVETPSCTATARGTTFVVVVLPNGHTRVVVFEGIVDVQVGGTTVTVHESQSVETGDDGRPGGTENLGQADLPVELGGTVVGWWEDVPSGYALQVTNGTSVTDGLRSSAVSDGVINDAPHSPFYISDATQRNAFLAVANSDVIPSVQSMMTYNNWTLDQFKATEGDHLLTNWGMPTASLELFASLGITTLGQALDAILANGGTISVEVRSRQVQYQPGAVNVPSANLRQLDRTLSSTSTLVTGLGLGLILDRGHWKVASPRLGGMLYGFSGTPGFIGGRGEIRGLIGKTRYILEGNALKFVNGPADDWATRIGSVSVVERDITSNLVAFAGRKRFYHGPVFQNQVGTQLIADRFSGAGLRWSQDRWSAEAAWLYDSNPLVDGTQRGALGTVTYKVAGGMVGLHLLESTKVNDGHGRTVSYAFPLITGRLDTYGEVGTGVDDASLQTYGFYFPSLFQLTDIDLFVEYGNHEGIGEAFSVVACKKVATDGELRAYLTRIDGVNQGGVAAIWRFGSYAPGDAGDTR